MDNSTGNNQISSQPSSNVSGAVLPNTVGTSSQVPQPVSSSVPDAQQIPSVPVSAPSTTQASPTSNITLEDLYGPSGFDNGTPQSTPFVPSSQGVAPVNNVSSQTDPLMSFAQVQTVPPNTPQVQQNTEPVVSSVQPMQAFVPSPQSGVYNEQALPELPLRKQQTESSALLQDKNAKNDSSQEPSQKGNSADNNVKRGPNTLLLLRILFGGIGVIIFIVVLLFAVTSLSSLFHPSASGKVTLTYWGLWEDSNTMQVVISAFERQHPDITVNYEKEDPKQYSQRLLTRIQQGNGPDIFTYHSSWLPMVQAILVPLPSNVISKNDLENNFYTVVRTDLVKNGALYGIPLGIDTLSLYVNNSLFQNAKAQVPTSWDTFGTTARALTQKDQNGKIKISGAALGTYDNITHAPDIVSALFIQNGVDITTMAPKTNAADALSFYTSFAQGDSRVWDSSLDPSQLAFAKGDLAMYFGYSWDIFVFKAMNPALDFSVHPIPHLPGRDMTAASYWVQGVSSKSLHQKDALLFLQFLGQKNTAAMLYAEEAKTRLFGEPYARSDLGASLANTPLIAPFLQQANNARSSFFAGETQDSGLNGQMNGYLGNAVRSILNNTSAASAVDTLFQGVQQIENQYGSG